jgi:hypothetical protein
VEVFPRPPGFDGAVSLWVSRDGLSSCSSVSLVSCPLHSALGPDVQRQSLGSWQNPPDTWAPPLAANPRGAPPLLRYREPREARRARDTLDSNHWLRHCHLPFRQVHQRTVVCEWRERPELFPRELPFPGGAHSGESKGSGEGGRPKPGGSTKAAGSKAKDEYVLNGILSD